MNCFWDLLEGPWTLTAGTAVQRCYSDIGTQCHIGAMYHRCLNQAEDLLIFSWLHGEPRFISHVLVTFFSCLVSVPNLDASSYNTWIMCWHKAVQIWNPKIQCLRTHLFKQIPLCEQLSQLEGVTECKTGNAEPETKGTYAPKIILRATQQKMTRAEDL